MGASTLEPFQTIVRTVLNFEQGGSGVNQPVREALQAAIDVPIWVGERIAMTDRDHAMLEAQRQRSNVYAFRKSNGAIPGTSQRSGSGFRNRGARPRACSSQLDFSRPSAFSP
jgi:hypothetical protein